MKLYLAPMEGITTVDFRANLNKHFGNIDIYMTPFIPASKNLSKKQIRDLDFNLNAGMKLVPQLIGNDGFELLLMCEKMKALGFQEININLGCPSGTVTSKKRGSGLLQYPELLNQFLYDVYSKCDIDISIKTRIGYASPEEWDQLLEIYKQYPLHELIIHPRIRQEFYSGTPHFDAFQKAVDQLNCPLVYNGDIDCPSAFKNIQTLYPSIDRFMIGRGLIANPALARLLNGQEPASASELQAYHDELIERYLERFLGPKDMIFHMKEIWSYFRFNFEDMDKYWKKIKKTNDLNEYKLITKQIFEHQPLKEWN